MVVVWWWGAYLLGGWGCAHEDGVIHDGARIAEPTRHLMIEDVDSPP